MNHILSSFKIESALVAAMREATKGRDAQMDGVQIAIAHVQDALKMDIQQRLAMNTRVLAATNQEQTS
jgi:hypothetical protein